MRVIWPAVIAVGVITLLCLLAMWPRGGTDFEDPLVLEADPIDATVVAIERTHCSMAPLEICSLAKLELSSGGHDLKVGEIEQTGDGRLGLGDEIRVVYFEDIDGQPIFSFYDYQRGTPMLMLFAVFSLAVLALGRWRGLGALAGLAVSMFVIVAFVLPAVLNGSNAVLVAVVAASAIAYVSLFLAHGFELTTAVALMSTLTSLVLTAVLASVFVGLSHLTGFVDDSSLLLSGLESGIDPRGILLAGVVIGSLGVLDDVTVTQVSAVWQLKSVQPELTAVPLARSALRIGRDHISSTVNTLFLAYAGSALPLLLLFVSADQGLLDVLTREIVATEVVRTLVGSIGLVASVPIATWLAAVVVGAHSTGDSVRPTA